MAVALRDAYYFNTGVNETRGVNDMRFNPAAATRLRTPELSFMEFQASRYSTLTAGDVDGVIDYFRRREGNFYYFGECTIVYALTGRPSPSPYLWYHPGLTVPPPDSPRFARVEDEAIRNLFRYNVRFFVVGDNAPPQEAFPRLWRHVADRVVGEERIGGIRILELAGGP